MNIMWPAIRAFYRNKLYKRCSRCILNERYTGIDLVTGLCSLCSSNDVTEQSEGTDETILDSMNERIKSVSQTSSRFHAVLLFSGGKDSCYMLLRLKEDFPDLRILCLSIDNTFMSPVAIENTNIAVKKMGVEHLWIRLPADMMSQVFRRAILNEDAMVGVVDMIDGELLSDIARTTAKQFDAPLIFMGLSPEQVEGILGIKTFEQPVTPDDCLPRKMSAGLNLIDLCDEKWHSWWWSGVETTARVPRFIFPHYGWKVSQREIVEKVAGSNIVPMKRLSPILTNHQLIIPMAVTDYIRRGWFTYEPELASTIRAGRSSRKDWISIFEFIEIASKTGKLLDDSFDQTLTRLGLTRESLRIRS